MHVCGRSARGGEVSAPAVPLLRPEPVGVEMDAVRRVVESGRFVGGDEVERFASRWAARTGTETCAPVSSGTAALTLILRALRGGAPDADGFDDGMADAALSPVACDHDEDPPVRDVVVVPGVSFVATLEAVLDAGCTPAVCDVDARGLMDPAQLARVIAEVGAHRVLAVVPVHLYGQVADVDAIGALVDAFEIPHVVEDACQAHGARYWDGSPVGSRGNPAAWSFMPAKILGAWGDAGAVTGPHRVVEAVRRLADHGRVGHADHAHPGTNARMAAVQAAVLNARLEHLDAWGDARAAHALAYVQDLGDLVRYQQDSPGRAWSYFAVWTRGPRHRDALVDHMRTRGIGVGVHYPYTLASVWRDVVTFAGDPRAFRSSLLSATTLTLPLWPGMSVRERDLVVRAVREFYG